MTLTFGDVYFGAQVLGQVSVDAERDAAVVALERSRIVRLAGVLLRALVPIEESAVEEGDATVGAAEWALHVVDVLVELQLVSLAERLGTDRTDIFHVFSVHALCNVAADFPWNRYDLASGSRLASRRRNGVSR